MNQPKSLDMTLGIKHTLIYVTALTASNTLLATTDHSTEKIQGSKQVIEEIYKKCLAKGSNPIEQEVCKARRPAIEQCVDYETAAKDAKAAKVKCELLYIAPTKK